MAFRSWGVGLWRWLPILVERRQAEEELLRANQELEQRARRDSDELALKTLDLEREIRERQQAASALRRSEEILQTVLSNAPVASIATDPVGRVTLAQGNALPTVGVDSETVLERSVFEVFRSQPEVFADLERALDGERVSSTAEVRDKAPTS